MNYSFEQWMADTKGKALRTRGRSAELKAIDEKFESFQQAPDSIVRKIEHKNALQAWKDSKGPGDAWKRSARVENRAVEQLDAMLGGVDEETAFNRGRVPDFMHENLVHSRMGVLYLFSNLSLQPNVFSMVIEGGLNLAGQAVGNELNQAKAALGDTPSADQLAHVAGLKRAKKGIGLANKAQKKLGVGKKLNKLESKIFKQGGKRADPPPPPPTPTTVTAQQVLAAPEPKVTITGHLVELEKKLTKFLTDLVEKIKDKLRDRFGLIQDIGGAIPKVIAFIVKRVCAEAVPLAGSIVSLIQKTGSLCLAVANKFQTWLDGRHVELNQGHPTTVVDSIKRAQTGAMLKGIYDLIVAAAGVAIDATAWGSGAIFNMVKSGIELLIKFVYRIGESLRFNKFCTQAREYYDQAKQFIGPKMPGESVTANVGAIVRRPFEFARWYRSYALSIPLIAILTLNSGIAGDKMAYLTLFNDDGMISSEKFLAGARFLDDLKPWGAEFLAASGYTINANGDVLVDKLANTFAKGQLSELATKGIKADGTMDDGDALIMAGTSFGTSRDVGKSNIRLGAERLFKGFVKG